MITDYQRFIETKSQHNVADGFEPINIPDYLFDFQKYLVEWAIRKGRAAIFADCGMGKTPMQLVWAENVVKKTNKPVMIVTPLAVGSQAKAEAEKFGIESVRTKNGVVKSGTQIYITNYEQLHKYDSTLFGGCVCDESSAIKDFTSERKKTVTEFMRSMPYRLLCTATAAPNDYWELGTSSEALGHLGFRDMITMFFKQETSKDHLGWGRTKYRFRGHAEEPFWSWVCSWAMSLRKPSDLGYDDSAFQLPPLHEKEIVVSTATARDGMLFSLPARDIREERAERRHSMSERCELAADIVKAVDGPSIVWCGLNPEGDLLEKIIPGAKQVCGSMSDEEKEETLTAFSTGNLKRLVTKPQIGAWGLNWQHCSDVVVFPSHSFEQFYQLIRRCYRYGQKKTVNVSIIVSEGERGVIKNLERKKRQASELFDKIVSHMKDSRRLNKFDRFDKKEKLPAWMNQRKETLVCQS